MANGKCVINGGPSDPLKFRIVLMGQGRVGKTAILRRFLEDDFVEKYRETVDDLHTRKFDINGVLIKADILDTAGNLPFPAMRRLNISTAQAFVLVYSVDSKSSFQEIQQIFQEIHEIRGATAMKSLPIVVVCNKIDLDEAAWQVHKLEVEEFMMSKTLDFSVAHLEASAKMDANVRDIFVELVKLSGILNADMSADVAEMQNGSAMSHQRRMSCKSPQRRFSLQTHNSLASFPLSALTAAANQHHSVPTSAGASPRRRPTFVASSYDGAAEQIKAQMQALQLAEKNGRRKGSLPLVKHKSLSRESSKNGGLLKRRKSRTGDRDGAPECYVQ